MLSKAKNNKITRFVLTMLPFGLILMNIKLFNIEEAAFKPIHVIVIIVVIIGLSKGVIKKKSLLIMLLYVFIPLFSLTNIVSLSAFISTYLIYIMSLLLVFIGLPQLLKIDVSIISKMFIVLFRAFNITAIYGVVQFMLANVLGNYSLYNNLGKFQFHPHYYNRIFGIDRATSIYIEPSVFAWVAITVMVIGLYLLNTPMMKKGQIKMTIILASLSVLISFSASGFISYFLVLVIFVLCSQKRNNVLFYKCVLFFIIVILIILQPKQLKYLRLGEITRPGTSGYARVTEPFYAMKEVLSTYPIVGRGLGQIGVYDSNLNYNVYINNSIFGIIVTFGLSAITYIIPICHNYYKLIKRDKFTAILFVNFIMIFLTTGSFLSLEMPLIYCLYLLAIRYKESFLSIENSNN